MTSQQFTLHTPAKAPPLSRIIHVPPAQLICRPKLGLELSSYYTYVEGGGVSSF
jgi:hypothetical protein